MKKEYLDIVFKAVSLKDIELLVFVLSKDINKDMFKSLSKIIYKDNKNVYEYLLVNNEYEMLDVFIKFGYWAHINIPVNNNETLIELAYKYKSLPIIVSILSNDNINYSSNDPVFKNILDKVKQDYQVSSFLLSYIDKHIEKVSYPQVLTENNFRDLMDKIKIEEGYDISLVSFHDGKFGEKIESVTDDALGKIKKLFNKVLNTSKEKNNTSVVEEYNKLETETETTTILEDDTIQKNKHPTTEEIRSKIRSPNENVKDLLDEIEIAVPKSSGIQKKNFDLSNDSEFKINSGFIKDFNEEKEDKNKIEKIIKHVLSVFCQEDIKQYATINNFINILHEYNINVLPKIENDNVSSFDFIFNNQIYSLSYFDSITMKEIRDILEINNEDNLFLINEKIKYFKLNENVNKEYIRLFITKSFMESVSLVDFIIKIKNEHFIVKTNIKDFNLENTSKENLEEIKDAIVIYSYEKDEIIVEDNELPEIIRFPQIKNKLL